MPALSPSMDKGKIQKWNFKEGDKIEIGDAICEVETDKSTVGFEATEEMYLAKILIPEGEEIEVGHIVAISVDCVEDIQAFKNYTNSDAKQEQQQSVSQQQVQSKSQTSGKSYPEYHKLNMPALSPSMERGKIQKWNFKVGDKVEVGDAICEVETDKSTVGFESTEEFYIAKILVQEGEEVEVGHNVAIAVDSIEDIDAFKDYVDETEVVQSAQPQQQQQQKKPQQVQQQPQQRQSQQNKQSSQSGDRVMVSPLAKNSAAQLGVDLSQIKGSGLGGRIILEDVLAASKTQSPTQQPQSQVQQQQQQQIQQQVTKQAAPQQEKQPQQKQQQSQQFIAAENPYTDIPTSSIRKVIAKRLQESKQQVPHFQLSIDVNVDQLMKVRSQLNKNEGIKVSVNDFVVKASSLALRDVPQANSIWLEDKIRQFKNADISIAVSTDGGLITPIVFEANKKGLSQISAEVKELAKKARDNKLQPKEFQGGSFTISNLGMFGIDSFTAIINPPQSCILAVSQSTKKMVYDASKEGQEVPFSVANIMNVCMSCDHRVVDGAVGAQFLQKFKFYIENPTNMLL